MRNLATRSIFPVAAALLVIGAPICALGAPVRGNLTLDDGVTVVVVDSNAHGWTPTEIASLVLGADRSTKDDCIWTRATKGLFQTGDRIFITYKYIAWLSSGKGTVRGLWALDPATRNFRHYRVGPEGCSWAHNELVTGSASPQGQFHFWDQHAPPIEHSMHFEVPSPTGNIWVGISHESAVFTASGNYQVLVDGVENVEGVMYASGARMAANIGSGWTVDVGDGNEANGIQNWIDSQVAFIFRPDDMRVIWRFSPATAPIYPSNTYYWLWLNYSFDLDGLGCDTSPGNGWPDQWWGEPRYFQSNKASSDRLGGSLKSPLAIVGELPRGTACAQANPGHYIDGATANGDWVRFGESSTLAAGTRRLTLSHEVDAGWGVPLVWDYFGVANEAGDGVWGAGGQRFAPIAYSAGTWYTTSYVVSVQ
jgi:hypothetical protein